MRKIGISSVSLWPRNHNEAIALAKSAGFDGIQALPMRRWTYEAAYIWGKDVISYEDAFAHGDLWEMLGRTFGILDEPAPTFVDYLLFNKKRSGVFKGALRVAHSIPLDSSLYEPAPEGVADMDEILNIVSTGVKLCFDTLHIVRKKRDGGSAIKGDWDDLIDALPADSVGLIHAHPSIKQVIPFIRGEKSELTEMLFMLGQKFPEVPVIVEVWPLLFSHPKTLRALRDSTLFWMDS